MKKKYLTYAGIISAILLVIMFAWIFLTGSFSILSPVTIDPIPDHVSGDLVVIKGTTNLMAGTRLVLDIVDVAPAPGEKPRVGGTDAFIVRGGGMSNVWSGALDTSAIPPGEYTVNAYWVNETVRSDLLATSRLRLIGTIPSPTGSPTTVALKAPYITISPPGTIWHKEKFLVTGTTNLPVDTELLYVVVQQSNTSVFTVDPKTGKQEEREGFTRSGIINVLPGNDGINRWSFAVDSTEFIPSTYLVIVTLESIKTEKIGIERPYGVAPLVVKDPNENRAAAQVQAGIPCTTITINDFPDRWFDQTFRFSGTTSLPPGTELSVQVIPTEYDLTMNMGTPHPAGTFSGAAGTATVEYGWGDTGIWSFSLDKKSMAPNQRNYLVNVSNDWYDIENNATISGDAFCTQRLTLPD
jgi:hypothetical protein